LSDASKIHINYDPEGFWGFPDVPFHQQMGITFTRDPDGSSVVGLPENPELVGAGGEQSSAAVYSIAEIASALRTCDELAAEAKELPQDMYPVMLARDVRFRFTGPARGDIAAHTRFVGDRSVVMRKIEKRRKGNVTIAVEVSGGDGQTVAEAQFDFYVRVMSEERLLAMTAAAVGSGAGN
jgi:acyl-coenzyme A thioesterase PaaI-like protein